MALYAGLGVSVASLARSRCEVLTGMCKGKRKGACVGVAHGTSKERERGRKGAPKFQRARRCLGRDRVVRGVRTSVSG